jgi:hypothetical protein
VLAFRAGRSVVVCSSAFEKERRIPDREIDNAIAQREQYLAAVRAGRVQWHTIPEQSE